MAPESVKMERKKWEEEALKDSIRGQIVTAVTDEFQCGKCKKRRCTYTQKQTRSADEPMTTFVLCLECGLSNCRLLPLKFGPMQAIVGNSAELIILR